MIKASRETEELYNAIVKVGSSWRCMHPRMLAKPSPAWGPLSTGPAKPAGLPCLAVAWRMLGRSCSNFNGCLPAVQNDIKLVYKKIEEGADVNFVFGERRWGV